MEAEPARWSRVNCALCPGCILAEGHEGECDFVEEDGVYEVEDILDERSVGRGRKEYRVKWRGWPEEDCTWELAASLKGCSAILRAWKTRRRGKPPQVQKRAAPPKKASDDMSSRAKVARNSKKGDAVVMKEGKASANAAAFMGGGQQVEADEVVEHTAASPCADAEAAEPAASASAHGDTAVSASAHGDTAVSASAHGDTAVSASAHGEEARRHTERQG
ncbi:hypothetical protein AB1Y20_022852 [Prymnesium parvum]|uniref:Chromo domain-containing protein n=1 Tax=Prymnesium parvum TaxID=97485 RepID=A0AB34JCP1_PRYPA